jgi:hypothetical protein
MRGNFLWRSVDQKQGVNKKQSFVACAGKNRMLKFTFLPQAEAKGST